MGGQMPITPTHGRARLQLCLARSSCNQADWGCIELSDESHFQLCPDDHQRRAWKRLGWRADLAFTIALQTGFQPGVMVWEAISLTDGPL
ncbi:transposable element Tc1 transposase [Trichonephila clavipes]|nr:transposable element Tc1 transposase [Trichonephila clavipes]